MVEIKKKRTYSISLKTSVACSIIVLLLLTVSSLISINMQLSMSKLIVSNFEQSQKKSLEADSLKLEESLLSNVQVNTGICSNITQNFIYNFDQSGLSVLLENYLKMDGIIAIKVLDAEGKSFVSAWKNPEIAVGSTIPDDMQLDENLSVVGDAIHESEKVGTVRMYYTRDLIRQDINKRQMQTDQAIVQFNELFHLNIKQSIISQIEIPWK
ncbi:MAG: hypothetical protein HQK67_07310 [Desulfamplus sp.]|nr:hypothetical protein [Desulfamplus sp.]